MKVYIVLSDVYDESTMNVEKVFSTEEKAKDYIRKKIKDFEEDEYHAEIWGIEVE